MIYFKDVFQRILKDILKCVKYASILDILLIEYNNCKNCKMIEDFSIQFNPLYLHTKIVPNILRYPV